MFFFNYFLPYGRIDRPWPQIGECSASSFDWWLVVKKSTVGSGRKILLADKLDERHDDIYDICPLVNAKSVAVWFL
jgi:hypothetical protein